MQFDAPIGLERHTVRLEPSALLFLVRDVRDRTRGADDTPPRDVVPIVGEGGQGPPHSACTAWHRRHRRKTSVARHRPTRNGRDEVVEVRVRIVMTGHRRSVHVRPGRGQRGSGVTGLPRLVSRRFAAHAECGPGRASPIRGARPRAPYAYGRKTMRAGTRPASTSAMAWLTSASGRISRVTCVFPWAWSSKTS